MSAVNATVRKGWIETATIAYSWCGLLTAEPVNFSAVSEVEGGSRLKIEWSIVESSSLRRNAKPLVFDKLEWGQRVSHVGLFNTQEGGVLGFWGALLQPTVIERGTLSVQGEIDDYTRLGVGTFKLEALDIGIRIE